MTVSLKEKNGIEMIQQGRIDFYIPLKFETSLNYEGLCSKLSGLVKKSIDNHLSGIQSDLHDAWDSVQDNMYTEQHGKLPFRRAVEKWNRDRREAKRVHSSRENDDTCFELSPTDRGMKLTMNPGEMLAYKSRCELLEKEQEKSETIYGAGFVCSQCRYVLWPIRIELNSGEFVWLNAIMFVFENLMGILKLELPLKNVSSQPLMDYDYDSYIKGVDDKWGVIPKGCELTIKALRSAYVQKFANEISLKIIAQETMLRNIILVRFDNMPKQVHSIPVEVQEDLFRIIAAPVPNLGCTSYRQEARNFIEKQSWGNHNVKYILSPTGGCLSIVDMALVEWLSALYKEKYKVDELNTGDLEIVGTSVIEDSCINVEFALVIPLLKFLNSVYVYHMKCFKPQEMHEVQRKYNQNIMFISKLQEYCYGSASEQVETFERLMPYYLKESTTTEKIKALDCIIADDERQRYDKLQSFLSIGGLVMALVFGLPAIYETIRIIRGFCTFLPNDIPVLTITNTSVGVWIVLIVVLLVRICRSRKICKKANLLL